jgi:hypothetical protein
MELRHATNLYIPKLSWVAEVNRGNGIVSLQHGSSVEVREKFFIEGAWNGPFQEGEFGETDCVFGTGGIICEDSIRFVTSASTVDYLYYDEDGPNVRVSNSLPSCWRSSTTLLIHGIQTIHQFVTQ